MNRIVIKPQWMFSGDADQQRQKMPALLGLLSAIYEDGNLTRACVTVGISYRYAWGLIRNGVQIFGVPLVKLTRGQGAKLTALGEKLVWADKRIVARLAPILDSLASELESEIERARADSRAVLRIYASHGYAVAMLRDFLLRRQIPVELQFRGGMDALASMSHSNCELAGFHVPVGSYQPMVLAHYAKLLRSKSQKLIAVSTRRQGIMVAKGNPLAIRSFADLGKPGIRFVNRQLGSGTRMLLELMLEREQLDSRSISGFEVVEFTHDAVAAYIASGMADAGLGVEPGARKFNLDFIPLVNERYFLACHDNTLATPPVQELLLALQSNEFRTVINNQHGLDSANSGAVMSIDDAFPDLPQ